MRGPNSKITLSVNPFMRMKFSSAETVPMHEKANRKHVINLENSGKFIENPFS
jgi:hypothetical protein